MIAFRFCVQRYGRLPRNRWWIVGPAHTAALVWRVEPGGIGVLGDWIVETVDALCQEGATAFPHPADLLWVSE